MSWISVDQKLLGGKLRELRKAIQSSRNEAIGILIGLWLWGMDNANPDGTLRGCDRDDLAEQIKIGLDRRYDPAAVVDALISKGWVDEGEGGILQIHDWNEWRKHYNKYMTDKERNRERVRKHREKVAEEQENDKDNAINALETMDALDGEPDYTPVVAALDPPETPKVPQIEKNPGEKKRAAYPADFAEFWKVYPRHDEKGNAYKKWLARLNDGYSPEELLEAAKGYAEQCRRNNTAQNYTKQAKTFLSDTMPFLDFIQKEKEQAQTARKEPGYNPFL